MSVLVEMNNLYVKHRRERAVDGTRAEKETSLSSFVCLSGFFHVRRFAFAFFLSLSFSMDGFANGRQTIRAFGVSLVVLQQWKFIPRVWVVVSTASDYSSASHAICLSVNWLNLLLLRCCTKTRSKWMRDWKSDRSSRKSRLFFFHLHRSAREWW